MDWSSSKGPSWDWPELEQQQSFVANNNNNNNIDGSRCFSVDLKLGSVITSETQLGVSDSPPVLPLPTKRARAANNNTTGGAAAAQQQVVYCLVDDCRSDLSNCRDYHRRHKVCEAHSKTPEVTIQGRKQRFCQQCSRFHAPEEFDEGKRSCRKRLDGHNRRRRKPPPETHLQQGTYMSNYTGTGMLSFSNPSSHNHTMSRAISPTSCWSAGSVNRVEHNISSPYNKQHPQLNLVDKQSPFSSDHHYSSTRNREAKRLTFLQAEYHRHPESSSEHYKVLYASGGIQQAPPPDSSDCALSLLSRPTVPMHATEINIRNNTIPVQSSSHHVALLPRQPTSHFSSAMQQPAVSSSDHVNFHNILFQPDHHHGSSGNHNEPQTLPFYWD